MTISQVLILSALSLVTSRRVGEPVLTHPESTPHGWCVCEHNNWSPAERLQLLLKPGDLRVIDEDLMMAAGEGHQATVKGLRHKVEAMDEHARQRQRRQ